MNLEMRRGAGQGVGLGEFSGCFSEDTCQKGLGGKQGLWQLEGVHWMSKKKVYNNNNKRNRRSHKGENRYEK